MKKQLLLLAGLLLFGMESMACDACGSAASGNGIGLLNNYRRNVVGFRYANLLFQPTAQPDGGSTDRFLSGEIFCRYQILPRLRASVQVPLRRNERTSDGATQSINGLADIRLAGVYTLLDNLPIGAKTKLYWELGAGAKLPTGQFDPSISNSGLPDNFNLGNGAWGWLAQTGVVLSRNGLGLSLNANAQLNGESSDGYHFGHQFGGTMVFFGEISLSEKAKLVPFGGPVAEKTLADEHANGHASHGTGGSGLFALGGLNLRYDRWQIGSNISQPITQNYADGEVSAGRRITVEMNYFF